MTKSEIQLSLRWFGYMKIDIPYYIKQILREKRAVVVPNIGTFTIVQTPATFNDDKTSLSPPILNVVFNEQVSETSALKTYIMDSGAGTEEKIGRKLDEFSQKVIDAIVQKGSFVLEGMGKLYKEGNEDTVQFEADTDALTMEYNDLRPLSVSPVVRIKEQLPIATHYQSPVEEDSGSFLPRIIVLALLFIALYFIASHFLNRHHEGNNTPIGIESQNNPSEDLPTLDSNVTDLQEKYQEIDELIDPINNQGQKDIPTNSNEDNGSTTNELDNETMEDGLGGYAESSTNTEGKDNQTLEKGEEKEVSGAVNKHADIIPASGNCIIIVGSFIKSLNTIKMVSLLERKGYTVHQSQYKGLTRVGIVYKCLDKDLEEYLQTIRQTISKKAWYLDPELEVPYIN